MTPKYYALSRSGLWLLSLFYVPILSGQILPAQPAAADSRAVYQAIQRLGGLDRSEVSAADLLVVDSALVQKNIPFRDQFFLLAGWLERRDALLMVPLPYRRAAQARNAYDMALIRAGDTARIAQLMDVLQQTTVDDAFIYDTAPKLLYTHHRAVIDFFFDQILLDQLNCDPADMHTEGQINCGYRLLEMVAPVIEDFPLSLGPSGDLLTENYPAALEIARAWIRTNRTMYQIKKAAY